VSDGCEADAPAGHIRRASIHEVEVLVGLLVRAFLDDPIERWCLACDAPEELLELEFSRVVEQLAAEGWIWVSEDLSGACAWIPPGSGYDDETIDAEVSPVLSDHGGHPERMTGFWQWVDRHRPAEPHWYVDLLATDPARRGLGVGTLLLQHGLERADAHGDASFLVTGNPRVVPWYERHGFTVLSREEAPGKGPIVWFMSRHRPP
jgi:GNAT superfamily N-acetyltransferase